MITSYTTRTLFVRVSSRLLFLLLVARASVCLGQSFATPVDYTVGMSPTAVAVGDLNGDGKPDLAVANFNNQNVSVMLGTGDGTFSAKVDYVVGGSPIAIVIADLNSDGKPEFVNSFNALSNAQYVSTLMDRYSLTQITTPDPSAPDGTNKVTLTVTDLTNALNGGTLTRSQVLRAISDSDQIFSAEFFKAFVAMQYYGYLRRTPESGGYNAWLNYLNANPSDFRTMVNGFMNSIEYRLRFGP